jgi:hypothetical protein
MARRDERGRRRGPRAARERQRLPASAPEAGSRHQRWYQRHHAASKARSALRGWALRNRTHEIAESAIAVGSVCLPKDLRVDVRSDALPGNCGREQRTLLLRELEQTLVAGKAAEVKGRAEHFASEVIARPANNVDDLIDLGRAFDLIRDAGTFVSDLYELRQGFERQLAICRALDAYWYRISSLDRRRFTPYLVKSFLHQASLWRIYGFLTDGSVEYYRAEELARHALQAIDAASSTRASSEQRSRRTRVAEKGPL